MLLLTSVMNRHLAFMTDYFLSNYMIAERNFDVFMENYIKDDEGYLLLKQHPILCLMFKSVKIFHYINNFNFIERCERFLINQLI